MKDDTYWKETLTPEAYAVLRKGGTEPAFTGSYVDEHRPGRYRCGACNAVLFDADDKFDSGSGWPSFTKPSGESNVGMRDDTTHGMRRTEVFCTNCGSHLGHVFPDGPKEAGGMRYCINSICLDLETPNDT